VQQVWDGTTLSRTLTELGTAVRNQLAEAAKTHDWPGVFIALADEPRMINSTRPDGQSRYAPLHQAAHAGAPVDVVKRLIALGAWRSLRNAHGERPVDIARRMGHTHLLEALEPPQKNPVPPATLRTIQIYFHAVIRIRAQKLLYEHRLRLPELEVLQELDSPQLWFAVPGMYGGFNFQLEANGADSRLHSESWSRVVGGSGQRHEIDARGVRLTKEEFV